MKHNGMIFVIDGIDGTGKATQSGRLVEKLKEDGYYVKLEHFPNYGSPGATLVEWYLQGKLGLNAKDINAKQASIYYALDRYLTMKQYEPFLNQGGILVLDRYYQSNIVHQGGKMADLTEWNEYTDWITKFETQDIGIPKEDAVFYLLVKSADREKLIAKRLASNSTYKSGDKKDIHEQDPNHLDEAFISANRAAKKYGWNVIDCYSQTTNELRSIEDISDEIYQKVKNVIEKNTKLFKK